MTKSIDFSKAKRVPPGYLDRFRDKNGKLRIALAPQKLVKKYAATVKKILWAMDPKKGHFAGSLVTDESSLYDFSLSEKEISVLGDRLGLELTEDMKIGNIALAIHAFSMKPGLGDLDPFHPRRFKHYIVRCDFEKAADFAVATHEKGDNKKNLRTLYFDTLLQMLAMIPKSVGKDLEGFVLRVDSKGQVDGVHPKKGRAAIEFVRWEKLLSMPVKTSFGVDKTVGKLLWEATFIGFNQSSIQGEMKKLKDMVKSIKNGTAKLISHDDFIKKLRGRAAKQ